jgi:hypothetical protein
MMIAEVALHGLVGSVGVSNHDREAHLHDPIEPIPHVRLEPRDAA